MNEYTYGRKVLVNIYAQGLRRTPGMIVRANTDGSFMVSLTKTPSSIVRVDHGQILIDDRFRPVGADAEPGDLYGPANG